MTDQNGLKEVYAGHTIAVNYLKDILEQSDIGCLVKSSNQENFITGELEGTLLDFDRIYVTESDYEKAQLIVEDYKKSQEK